MINFACDDTLYFLGAIDTLLASNAMHGAGTVLDVGGGDGEYDCMCIWLKLIIGVSISFTPNLLHA